MQASRFTFVLAAMAALTGCDTGSRSTVNFALPEGNAEDGQEVFIYMQCHECHTISGVELPEVPWSEPPYVALGGPVTRVKSYNELVTSIINPSHKLARGYAEEVIAEEGESKMPDYNGYMTVQELIDLVTFLRPHYELMVPMYDYRDFQYPPHL